MGGGGASSGAAGEGRLRGRGPAPPHLPAGPAPRPAGAPHRLHPPPTPPPPTRPQSSTPPTPLARLSRQHPRASRPVLSRRAARGTHLIVAAGAGARGRGRGAGRGALAGEPAPGAAAPRLAGLRGAAGAHLLGAGVRAASCGDGLRRRRLTAGPRPLPSWRARARAGVCARRRGQGGRRRGGGERAPAFTRGAGPGWRVGAVRGPPRGRRGRARASSAASQD